MKELTAQEVLRNTFDHLERIIGEEGGKGGERPLPGGAEEGEEGDDVANSTEETVAEGTDE